MAWYYVKDVAGVDTGTATGDAGRYATQQTGSFAGIGAAGYYSNIGAALAATTPPVAGDFILVSDLHNYEMLVNLDVVGFAPATFSIIAVDDANVNQSRTVGNRFKEWSANATIDVNLTNSSVSGGILEPGDDVLCFGSVVVCDSELGSSGFNDKIVMSADGLFCCFKDTELNTTAAFQLFGGVMLYCNNTSLTLPMDDLFSGAFINGGGVVRWMNSDITNITGTLLANVGSDPVEDDLIDILFDSCKLAVGVAFTNESFSNNNHRMIVTRCSSSDAPSVYQYYNQALGGSISDDSTTYKNEDIAWETTTTKTTYQITTNTDASGNSPLWFDFPNEFWAQLSTTNTLTFFLTSDTVLTNKDFYIGVSYAKSIARNESLTVYSCPVTVGGSPDVMAAGVALTVDAVSTYTGGLTNKYKVSMTLTGGADTKPNVKIYCTKPSVVINLSPIAEQS